MADGGGDGDLRLAFAHMQERVQRLERHIARCGPVVKTLEEESLIEKAIAARVREAQQFRLTVAQRLGALLVAGSAVASFVMQVAR